ncbi:ROK family protein [Paenibacillus sp. S150]|uniref:ROK family protein n=1 Tax=Paenibacillus sp. S150 TaxID=2749826 RepID=UPI001C575DB3|nr:ROK family protein [Paenibacillus sp. S150]MBW4080347.1 ROK family protein [Paenibacillus sp. S150]
MNNIVGNALVIKEVNINLVRRVLRERKQATKRQIAEDTGLSIVTAGSVLEMLVRQNEVLEAGQIASSGGRPAQQYIYNDEHALALIMFPFEEQGGISILNTVVTLSGRCLHEASTPVPKVDLACFEHIIDEALKQFPAIEAIGFGLPGAEADGRLVVSDYDALRGVAVTEHFRQRYMKRIIIENDVNAAAIGHCSRAEAGREASAVYLYFPDRFPPGAGIIINGKLHKGRSGFAGEVANIPLGISWRSSEWQSSPARLTEAVARLTAAVSSVLNPDAVVLYGSFLQEEYLSGISEQCAELLLPDMVPDILLSRSFAADYLNGMIVSTLATLETGLQLTKSDG